VKSTFERPKNAGKPFLLEGVRLRPETPLYSTRAGSLFLGRSDDLLKLPAFKKFQGKAQLIFTSPPFPLNTKKKYGNLTGSAYIKWLSEFAPSLCDLLTPDGSIVIEIGNAWQRGEPVMSTTVLKALISFLESGGLHLCQEFVWYNPARLPSPVQWVNVERSRVKDAFTRIWWMSPVTRPKADNRRVLREYSSSMKSLIKNKKYNAGRRPSQHNIGPKSFAIDNGGAIPPNVLGADDLPSLTNILKGSNTRSSEKYQTFCRENRLTLHPARMPQELAEFFIRFLTDEGDLVVDPFAGSNTTGEVAEKNGRKWLSFESQFNYAAASMSRFLPAVSNKDRAAKIIAALQMSASSPPKSPALTS
jgi:site-specific DNA-methyltransferase (cytosine-N4-specific)